MGSSFSFEGFIMMANPKPYDQKKMFAYKNGQLIQNYNTGKTGVVVDVQYPEGPGQWCWVSVAWSDGRVSPVQPTRKYRLLEGN